MSQKTSREVVEPEKISTACSNFLHLFDEQWFFFNVIGGQRILPSTWGLNHEDLKATAAAMDKTASPAAPQLIRTPSLPPPGVGRAGSTGQEGEAVPRNYLSCRKLRYSYRSLDAPQQSTGRQRPPRTEAPHRRCANPHFVLYWEASYRKAFQNKKWRSLSDLETMELQGFKDLGFVFDDKKGLSSSLVRVIPALRDRKEEENDGGVRRLYFPEAWSAPPMVLRHVRFRSGEEMKEQLLFWARAVASNVRREC